MLLIVTLSVPNTATAQTVNAFMVREDVKAVARAVLSCIALHDH